MLITALAAAVTSPSARIYFLGEIAAHSQSQVAAMSADGSTVVGRWVKSNFASPFFWRIGRTPKSLPPGPNAYAFSPSAATGDGQEVIGTMAWKYGKSFPARWEVRSQRYELGKVNGNTSAASRRGDVIVGAIGGRNGRSTAVFYDRRLQPKPLPHPASRPYASAFAVSGDGKAVFGVLGARRPVRWIADRLEELGNDRLGRDAKTYGANFDGSVAVGRVPSGVDHSPVFEAFIWRAVGGMRSLGYLRQQGDRLGASQAFAVSDDGKLVVGSSASIKSGQRESDLVFSAFVWDSKHGMRDLRKLLAESYGLKSKLKGWRLADARGISADGKLIVGQAVGRTGKPQVYAVRLSERPDEH